MQAGKRHALPTGDLPDFSLHARTSLSLLCICFIRVMIPAAGNTRGCRDGWYPVYVRNQTGTLMYMETHEYSAAENQMQKAISQLAKRFPTAPQAIQK